MGLAILCSGQGRQHADMFALTGELPETSGLFAHAATLLSGQDPRDIVRTDSADVLHQDRLGQILCTLQALAAVVALQDEIPDRCIIAGYSVGELASWGAAGLLTMTDTLDLVVCRAEAMDASTSTGDGLVFIRGLSRKVVDKLCERHGAEVAIIEPDGAFIVGGSRSALNAFVGEANTLNVTRVEDLPVEVASHTNRLARASEQFRESLRHVATMRPLSVRLLSGIDGSPVIDTRLGLDKLAAQISQTVRWGDCLRACIEFGATTFLELGPGAALSKMVATSFPDVSARSLDDFKTLQGARDWLARRS